MLKIFATIILSLTTVTHCFGQFTFEVRKETKLKGRVDSCVTTGIEINYKDGEMIRQRRSKAVEYYNDRGDIIKKYRYLFKDNIDTAYIMAHPLVTVYNYDKNGGLRSIENFNANGIYAKDVFTFTNGNIEGVLKHYELTDYRSSAFTKIKLNIRGDLEKSILYHDSVFIAKPYKTVNYEYNAKGYVIKDSTSYSHTTRTNRNFYSYDKDDNLIQMRTPIAILSTPPTSGYRIQTYTYPKFDKLHNWLKSECYSDGRLADVFERQISYRK